MKTYCVVITRRETIDVNAETEEQAIEMIRSQLPPREVSITEIQVAQEIEPIKE